MLRIHLLGTAEVDPGTDEAVPLATQKVAELLAYLWLHRDRPQSRTQLAGLLWPETDEKRARQSLRTALHRLRQVLEPDDASAGNYLITERQSVQFNPDALCWVDVGQFTDRLDQADEADDAERIHHLQEAVSSYRGDLLEGCYEDWCLEERDHLKNRYLQALEELVASHAERKEYEPAIEYARQLLAINPLQEETHRQLMYLHYALDDRNAALQQYRACVRLLDEELGIEPLPETQALAREIEERVNPEHLQAVSPQAIIAKYPELGAPFVGRSQEFARLKAAWDRAAKGDGCSLFVSGEAGIGKTRLTQELIDHVARCESGLTLRGACYETEGRLPYQPWIDALRQAIATAPEGLVEQLSTIWVGEVMKLVPELMERFPEIQPRPALASPEQERNRLFEGLSRFLTELAGPQPLLIVLDDLQWADESTLQFTHYVMRKLTEAPICLVGIYRSGDVVDEHPLLDVVQHALKENLIETIELSQLTSDEVTELIGRMLKAEEGLAPLIDKINEDAAGNPFFAVELLKSLIETGAVRANDDGTWEVETKKLTEPELPQTVRAVVETRLRRLSRPSREVAQLASTRTRAFEMDFLTAAIGHRREDVADPLDELLKTHFLAAEGPRYRFHHDAIREVIYRGLADERRRSLHLQAGQTLESLHAEPDESDKDGLAGEVAEHFYHAEEWRKALDYGLRAAELAWSQSYAKDEALHFYQQTLQAAETLDDDTGRMQAYKGMGEVCAFSNEPEQGLEYCQKALEMCDDPLTRAEIHCAITNVYHQRRELEVGLAYAEKGLQELEPDDAETLTAVKAHYYAAEFLNWLMRHEEAIDHCREAIGVLEQQPNDNWRALVLAELGTAYGWKRDYDAAVDHLSDAARHAEEAGDPYSVTLAHFQMGQTYDFKGEIDQAIAAWKRALESLSQLSHQEEGMGAICNHLVYAHLQKEDTEQALHYAYRQYEVHLQSKVITQQATSAGMLGCLLQAHGSYNEAEDKLNEALEVGPEHGSMYFSVIQTYVLLDRIDDAIDWLERGLRYLKDRHVRFLKEPPREHPSYRSLHRDARFADLLSQRTSGEDRDGRSSA